MSLLGQGDTFAKLGEAIGGDATQAETAVETAAPAMVGGLAEAAVGDDGPERLAGLLDGADPAATDDVGAFLDGVDPAAGEGVLDTLFGSDRTALLDGLASRSGLDAGMFAALLPRLAPFFVGVLARRRQDDGLDTAGVAGLLTQERDALDTDGKLGDWFSNLLVGGGALAAVGGLGARAKGLLGDAVDEVKDFFDGDDGNDDDREPADAADADADGADTDGADTDDADTDGADDQGVVEGDPVDGDLDAAGEADGEAEAEASEVGDAGDGDGIADGDGGEVAAAADGDGSVLEDGAPAAVIGTDTEEIVVDGATAGAGAATAAATGAAVATATAVRRTAPEEVTVAPAAGGGRSGWLRWVIGAVVVIALLALVLTQCSKSSTDSSAPTTAAAAPTTTAAASSTTATSATSSTTAAISTITAAGAGDSALAALVQAALAKADLGSGVKATVANGVVTLTGTVATQEAKAAAEAAVKAVAGVARIDNQITVQAASPPADLQAKVNAALPAGIKAAVSGGVVTLTGAVDSQAAKEAAEKAVVAVAGVTKVDNQITVNAPTAPGTTLNDKLGLGPINFDYLSARILPPAAAELDKAVAWLQANPGNVEIQGYTDNDGPEQQNLELSQRRAASVKAYLVGKGIDGSRLSTVGFGEANPKVPNDSLDNKAINRRIELVLK